MSVSTRRNRHKPHRQCALAPRPIFAHPPSPQTPISDFVFDDLKGLSSKTPCVPGDRLRTSVNSSFVSFVSYTPGARYTDMQNVPREDTKCTPGTPPTTPRLVRVLAQAYDKRA